MDSIVWVETKSIGVHGGSHPAFVNDDRFDNNQWKGAANFGPPMYQGRSYLREGEEIARMLLCIQYPSHFQNSSMPARMLWNFEVREDLRGSQGRIGTTIVEQLIAERPNQEMYIGPTARSITFWRRFGWPMCSCPDCDGRDFVVRRPNTTVNTRHNRDTRAKL
jgi:hypothetical protein